MFNKSPKYVHIVSSCSVDKFKSQLDKHLRNILDLPCQPGFNNSLDGGHYADDLAAKQAQVSNIYNTIAFTSSLEGSEAFKRQDSRCNLNFASPLCV